MKKILSIMLAIVLVLSLAACGGNTEAKDGGKKTLRVGLECNYAPFNWTQLDNSNGAVPISGTNQYAGGYDVEVAKIIAEGLDMNLEIVKTDWEGLIPAVQSGTIDVVIAGMSPTAERAESIDFSDPYYTSDLVIVVRADGPYTKATTLADFNGARIVGQKGTFHADVVSQIPGVLEQTPMEDFGTMRVALSSGTIDGYVSERPGAESAITADPTFAMVDFDEGNGFEASPEDVAIAVGLKKGSDLTTKINEIIAGISEETRNDMMIKALDNQPAE